MTTPTPTPQAAPAPAASTPSAAPAAPHQSSEFPTISDWRSAIRDAEPAQPTQPVVSTQDQEPATEPSAADAKPEVAAAPPAAPVEEVDTASLGETDVALYQRIMDDLVAQHPTVEEKFLKRTADAQFQYLKAKEKIGDQAKDITKLLKDVKKVYKPPAATALEQSIAAPPAPPPTPTAAPATPAAPAEPVATPPSGTAADPVLALANTWQSEFDVATAQTAAWEAYYAAQNPTEQAAAARQLYLIDQAKARIQMAPLASYLEGMIPGEVARLIKEQLGDILPVVRQTAQQTAIQQDHEIALRELEGAGMTGIRDLFKVEEGEIEYNGQTFDNTPYNRIIAENPEILDIVVQHPDPRKANQLTQIKRAKIVARIAGAQQPPPTPTSGAAPDPAMKALMEASAQVQPAQAQSTRQSINAGPGASGAAPTPGSNFFESGTSAQIRRSDWFSK